MLVKLNIYDLDNEACPNCDTVGELTYISNCRACHCGDCGAWVDIEGRILEDE